MILLQLIGFLILFSGLFLVVLIALQFSSNWKLPKLLGASLLASVAITLLFIIISQISFFILRPVQPDRDDIIGHYEIDRSKWPGKNSDWQHKTYSLQITETHAILRDARTKTVWKYKIEWSQVYEHYWSFADYTKRHHMIDNGPTLYRARFNHYYTFHSPLYDDIFFRKK